MANNSYWEVLQWASSFLKQHQKEAHIAEYLLLERLGWSKTEWLLHLREEMPEAVKIQLQKDLEKVIEDYPPQYLIGSVDFYGERFDVNEATLIPRPETEELVALCLQHHDNQPPLKVVDIGTGTGAIAISLKKQRPDWQVSAIDLSPAALQVARGNAEKLSTDIVFYEGDLLEPVKNQRFDLVLSNPPYIAEEEWQEMDRSVRQYEPKLALFAENSGLAVYQRLAFEIPQVLVETGQVFLEIGYQQGTAVQTLFQAVFPEKKVEILQDMQGLDRMIWVHD